MANIYEFKFTDQTPLNVPPTIDISDLFTGFSRTYLPGGGSAGDIIIGGRGDDYFLKSNTITHGQSTHSSIKFTLIESGTISFDYKVSSESGYDWFAAHITQSSTPLLYSDYVNRVVYASGTSNPGYITYTSQVLTPGTYYLHFLYRKDYSGSYGDDCACVDNIQIPYTPIVLPIKIKINGTWVPSKVGYIKMSGTWNIIKQMWIKNNGTWTKISQ